MKTQSWRRFSIVIPFILLLVFSSTNWSVQASNLLGPTPYVPPAQGCDLATGTGTDYKTCAFYVAINEDDAGNKPECNSSSYGTGWPEIYFGRCNSGADLVVSGFRFQNVSVPIPSNQKVLVSYLEFTVDGPYGPNTITSNIYGQASTSPNSFSGTSINDILTRPTVQPTALWNIPSTNRVNNMGDPWSLGETRRTPDVTSILTAIMGPTGWQNNNSIAFLFKTISLDTTGSRRVLAKERVGFNPARLVVRVGEIPRPSVSYYWLSVDCISTICDPRDSILDIKASTEAQRNQSVLVILDFGNPRATNGQMGTSTVSQSKYIPISNIEDAAKRYIQTFVDNANTNSKLWLGIGTNNAGDLICVNQGNGSSHGTEWALMMNRLQAWVDQQPYNDVVPDRIQVSGASDIETWKGRSDSRDILKCGHQRLTEAPPSEALAWVQAYSIWTDVKFINFGNYSEPGEGLGINPPRWGADLTWELTWGIPEAYPLPEIYTPTGTLSENWQLLARYSAICTGCRPADLERGGDPNWMAIKGRTMQFLGTLTNQGEQSLTIPCSTSANSPSQGWLQLYRHLVVDLYTDNDFPIYSSDITFEDQEAGLSPAKTHETADTCATP